MLSKENADKLIKTGYYTRPAEKGIRRKIYDDNLFWCCNWVFQPSMYDGEWYMRDTYYAGGSLTIKLTDENFNDFTFVMDSKEVVGVSYAVWSEYAEHDRYKLAIGSGGIHEPRFFVKRDAFPDGAKMVAKAKKALEEIQAQAELARFDLGWARQKAGIPANPDEERIWYALSWNSQFRRMQVKGGPSTKKDAKYCLSQCLLHRLPELGLCEYGKATPLYDAAEKGTSGTPLTLSDTGARIAYGDFEEVYEIVRWDH